MRRGGISASPRGTRETHPEVHAGDPEGAGVGQRAHQFGAQEQGQGPSQRRGIKEKQRLAS